MFYQVYGIFDKNSKELLYIGSTTLHLKDRLYLHFWKYASTKLKRYIIQNNLSMEQVQIKNLRICEDKKEMLEIEKQLIKENKTPCNVNSLNCY